MSRPPVFHRLAVFFETCHDADHGYSLRHSGSNGVVNLLGDALFRSQTVYEEVDATLGVEVTDGFFGGIFIPESGDIINIECMSVDVHPVCGRCQCTRVHVGTERCVFAPEDQIHEGADTQSSASKDDNNVHPVALCLQKKKKDRMNDTASKPHRGETCARKEILTLSTGMGIVGDLGSNGLNPRNRLNTGVSLKSLVGAKNLLDAILDAGGLEHNTQLGLVESWFGAQQRRSGL